VDAASVTAAFRLELDGVERRLPGKGALLDRVRWVFVPDSTLQSGATYEPLRQAAAAA
jgi:hypothetical protein